jgi:hypothetical protein
VYQFWWEFQEGLFVHSISWWFITLFCHLSFVHSILFGIDLLRGRRKGTLRRVINTLLMVNIAVMVLAFPYNFSTSIELNGLLR